jgi:hypothetical protein
MSGQWRAADEARCVEPLHARLADDLIVLTGRLARPPDGEFSFRVFRHSKHLAPSRYCRRIPVHRESLKGTADGGSQAFISSRPAHQWVRVTLLRWRGWSGSSPRACASSAAMR